MNRCDICGQFGELKTVTLEIKKHDACDVNALFGAKQEPTITVNPTPTQIETAHISPVPVYVKEELKKMII